MVKLDLLDGQSEAHMGSGELLFLLLLFDVVADLKASHTADM